MYSGENYVFTFHYASTLSPSTCISLILYASFTFHYASTLSQSIFGYLRDPV